MPLPMHLWLALEEDVNRHKAELAQAFDEARARLLPTLPRPEHNSFGGCRFIGCGFEYHTAVALVAGV